MPYLTNLAGLLDRASAYAKDKKVDPAVLLALRLAPNMYSLRQQVDEVYRHAIVSCALLAGRDPLSFVAGETDIAELPDHLGVAEIARCRVTSAAECDGADVAFLA